MSVEETAAKLGISTEELFSVAANTYPDTWAPNPAYNHVRWRLWGSAFIPESVQKLIEAQGECHA